MASALEYELQMKRLLHRRNRENTPELQQNEAAKRSGFAFLKRSWSISEIFTTCVLFFVIFGWGLLHGTAGPTLLDFQMLTGTTTSQMGLTFPATTAGGIPGALLGGYILDKVNSRLYLAVVLLCFGPAIIVLPWARDFVSLMLLSVIRGIFEGALDTGINTTTLLLWGWEGAIVMQAFHCVYGIGTFVSAWVVAPFVLPQTETNASLELTPNASYTNTFSTVETTTSSGPSPEDVEGTRIQYVFLIAGVYFLVASMSLSLAYLIHVKQEELRNKGTTATGKQKLPLGSRQQRFEPLCYRIPMIILMALGFGACVSLEVGFGAFLTTFAVNGLHWSKHDSIVVTSVFRASFAVSRGIGVFLAAVVTPTKMVLKDLGILTVATTVLLFCTEMHDLVLWIGSGLMGFGIGSFYASSMSWADGKMKITGKAGSGFTLGKWIGALIIPAAIGYLFDKIGPFSFLYVCLFDTLLLAVVCLLAMIFAWMYHRRNTTQRSVSAE